MSEITLSAGIRDVLLSQQRTAAAAETANRRLATGLRVSSAVDDAPAFFAAQSLNNRVSDLLQVKDGIGQGLSTVEGALAGLDALEDLTRQLQGIALSVRGGSADQRAAAAEQFDALRGQITSLAADAGFSGINLISASPDTLNVDLNETGTASLSVTGQASDASGLGIGTAAGSFNGFAADTDIDQAVAQLDSALSALRSQAATLGSNVALLNTRETFTEGLTDTLATGAGQLVNADLNAEAAALLSLRVRNELGNQGLALAGENASLISQLIQP